MNPEPEFNFNSGEGIALRDAGIARAEAKQERSVPGWQYWAVGMFDRYPEPTFQTCEFANWCYRNGLDEAPEGRAWGAVIVRLQKMGRIVRHGFAPCADPTQHRTPVAVWRKA